VFSVHQLLYKKIDLKSLESAGGMEFISIGKLVRSDKCRHLGSTMI
jgi:hypothetical protein